MSRFYGSTVNKLKNSSEFWHDLPKQVKKGVHFDQTTCQTTCRKQANYNSVKCLIFNIARALSQRVQTHWTAQTWTKLSSEASSQWAWKKREETCGVERIPTNTSEFYTYWQMCFANEPPCLKKRSQCNGRLCVCVERGKMCQWRRNGHTAFFNFLLVSAHVGIIIVLELAKTAQECIVVYMAAATTTRWLCLIFVNVNIG